MFLALATPSWRDGPFTWWPIWRAPMLAGRPAIVGVLSLLPGVTLVTWLVSRALVRGQPWRWGRLALTLPLLGLSLLDVAGLDAALTWRTVVQLIGLALFWLVYLFLLNERLNLTIVLAVVLLLQSAVAVGQFLAQGDLGLSALGELRLDATTEGMSILYARDRPWLRGYGLTAHPNTLGAMLAVILLLLLPAFKGARGWRLALLITTFAAGLLGMLTSFSRGAWLALAAGIVTWLLLDKRTWRALGTATRVRAHLPARTLKRLLPLIPVLLLLYFYRDLVASRFLVLDTPTEAQSLDERIQAMLVAPAIIANHPWRGAGAGNYPLASASINPAAPVVHNVPLLVAVELGIPGALLWLWLALFPFGQHLMPPDKGGKVASPWPARMRLLQTSLAPWLALLVAGMFDNNLWLTTSWRAAILFAMLAANLTDCLTCRPQPAAVQKAV